MIAAANEVRKQLERVGLQGFLRTSGGKGFHVVVPLQSSRAVGSTQEVLTSLR